MNLYKAGNGYTALTVGYDGTVLGTLPISEQILDISASGKYLALLTSGALSIYDQNLTEYDVSDNTTGASSAVMREDGSAVLLANGHGDLARPVNNFPKNVYKILQRYDGLPVIYFAEGNTDEEKPFMKPTLCSRCKKDLAVVFITKIDGGKTVNDGPICLKCAKEYGHRARRRYDRTHGACKRRPRKYSTAKVAMNRLGLGRP